MHTVYGRDEVLSRARAWRERAFAGSGQLVLLLGEPGIGKSTLAEFIADEAAREHGAAVAWGRCWEAGGAPAYWPWIQIFRELGMDADPFVGALQSLAASEAETRFAAFDRAVRALRARAADESLVLVLDDLHAADTPSLLLLLLFARQLRGARIFIVGAYRDAEARLHPGAAELLAKLARESELVRLERLAPQDVASWVGEIVRDASPSEADDLFRWTEGHPLFLVEAFRLGPRSGARALRAGLASVLDEHVGRLSDETRELLEVAAVLGRDFTAADLATTAGASADTVHRALSEAVATSIVAPTALTDGFRFCHVLLRDTIYANLLPSGRQAIHFRAGTTLLAKGEPALSSAAHHFFESQGSASPEQVAEVALAAAEASLGRLAFEETARLARRALESFSESLPDALQARLKLALAEALFRLGDAVLARALAMQAAELAERTRAPELFARAALVYSTELLSGAIDAPMIALLRRALDVFSSDDSPIRARLLARLAAALTPPTGPETISEILSLTRGAITMARRLGDSHTLLYVMHFAATVALLVPEQERLSFMQQSVELATALDQPLILIQTLPGYITALLARGERAEAETALARYEELVLDSQQPLPLVHRALLRALFSLILGDFEQAERLNTEARVIAERTNSDAAKRLWLTQRVSFAILRNRPELVENEVDSLKAHFAWMANGIPYVAWLLLGVGEEHEAAELLRSANLDPASIPSANLLELVAAADACVRLGNVELGRRIYPTLVRAADRMCWAIAPGSLIGLTSRTLGDLARLLGRIGEATAHYDAAIAFAERLGSLPLIELCRGSRDATTSPSPVASPDTGAAPDTGASPEDRRPPLELQREQDVWALTSLAGSTFRLKHSKGLGYLHYLLDQPGRAVHVLELVGTDAQPGDAGPLLDPRAKAEYRERLDALREQLAEAEEFGDVERTSRLYAELDAITEQLAGAVGLGGRDRVAASVVERARVNVQRCLKDAIARIAAADPALGRYLSATVKSGTYCSYQPL